MGQGLVSPLLYIKRSETFLWHGHAWVLCVLSSLYSLLFFSVNMSKVGESRHQDGHRI